MKNCLRYLLIAVMAWLPVGQVAAMCCAPALAQDHVSVADAELEPPCHGYQADSLEQTESGDNLDQCSCGCSLIGHTSVSLNSTAMAMFHVDRQPSLARRAEPLPAHDFPLLRPPTPLS